MIRFSIPLRMKTFRFNLLFNSSKSASCSHSYYLHKSRSTIASMAQESSKGSGLLPKLSSLEMKSYNKMAVHMDYFVRINVTIPRALTETPSVA